MLLSSLVALVPQTTGYLRNLHFSNIGFKAIPNQALLLIPVPVPMLIPVRISRVYSVLESNTVLYRIMAVVFCMATLLAPLCITVQRQ